MKITASVKENQTYFDKRLQVDQSFDLISRPLQVGGRDAVLYFINGFCGEDIMQKMLQYFLGVKATEMPRDAEHMIRTLVPHVEVSLSDDWDFLTHNVLSGLVLLLIDGYTEGIIIDARDYPARGVDEPDKDKVSAWFQGWFRGNRCPKHRSHPAPYPQYRSPSGNSQCR